MTPPDRFRLMAERAPLGLFQADVAGTVVYANPRWRELTGVDTPLPLPLDVLLAHFEPGDGERVRAAFHDAVAAETEFTVEARVRAPNDSHRYLRMRGAPLIDPDGVFVGLVGSVADVTELEQAIDARIRSEQRYQNLIANAPVGQAVYDLRGRIVEVNRAWTDLLGYEPAELIGRPAASFVHPADRQTLELLVGELLTGQRHAIQRESRLVRKDGSIVWVAASIALERDLDGRPRHFHSLVIDVTERRAAELAVRESEARFRTLAESLPVGVYRADENGELVYVNPRWREITKVSDDEMGPGFRLYRVHPDDLPEFRKLLSKSVATRSPFHAQYRLLLPDGSTRWVSARAEALTDDSGEPSGYIGSLEDITPLVAAQEETARLASIIESTSDLVGICEYPSGHLIYLNGAGRQLFGYEGDDITGVNLRNLYTAEAVDVFEDEIISTLERGEAWSGELRMRVPGGVIQVWQTVTAERGPDGKIRQISAVGRDVTERRRMEAELAHRATHDPLTGLPNRVLLLDHLELAMARAGRDDKLVAVMFLDLDRFKSVNDTLGHDPGDELLKQVAARIASVLRPADTVARLGGDEFVVLCEDIEDEHHAMTIAQRISSTIETEPFTIGGIDLTVTASIGIALSHGGVAHPEGLLRDADAAMYRAKDLGRARLELFDESMRRRSAQRLELADQLATGIERGNIGVHYQPSVDLTTGRVTSVEALARWEHPERGTLSPSEFIRLAEETGLIIGLGLSVLSRACQQARQWEIELGHDSPRVHVNLSASQLTTSNLPVLVEAVLESSALTPSKLCLEITESVLMEDAPAVIDTLWQLKRLGVMLAIDDFGTGYSSLSYLGRFPVDIMKIDRSFIDGLGPDPEDSTIVAAIVNLAHTLDLETIAEGVETPEQIERLRALGCKGAQGFLLAKPLPATDLRPLLEQTFTL